MQAGEARGDAVVKVFGYLNLAGGTPEGGMWSVFCLFSGVGVLSLSAGSRLLFVN